MCVYVCVCFDNIVEVVVVVVVVVVVKVVVVIGRGAEDVVAWW